jgi:hypothetical protein
MLGKHAQRRGCPPREAGRGGPLHGFAGFSDEGGPREIMHPEGPRCERTRGTAAIRRTAVERAPGPPSRTSLEVSNNPREARSLRAN